MPFTTEILISPIGEELRTEWRIIEPLNFHSNIFNKNYVVPKGEVTDLASWLITAASAAAIVHDHLYKFGLKFKQIENRKEADTVFYEAMLDTGVYKIRAIAYYYAVRLFGWQFFNNKV